MTMSTTSTSSTPITPKYPDYPECPCAGGVTREWFLVLSREIFNQGYALFNKSVNSLTCAQRLRRMRRIGNRTRSAFATAASAPHVGTACGVLRRSAVQRRVATRRKTSADRLLMRARARQSSKALGRRGQVHAEHVLVHQPQPPVVLLVRRPHRRQGYLRR